MSHQNNPNDPNNDPDNNPNSRISLDLSLGIGPQEDDPQEQDPQEQAPVEEPSEFMQLLRSAYSRNIPMAGLLTSPPLGEAIPMYDHSSYPPQGQLFQPPPHPQAIQGGAGALEIPRPGPRLGRPPNGHQARRNPLRAVAADNNLGVMEIEPPYQWATTRPAVIHSLRYLYSNNINVISGEVHCRPCDITQNLEYSLADRFEELYRYIKANKDELRHRAPDVWMNPTLPPCISCESGMKPVIGENKENINWLFLLLGQMLGCCTLEQLRYFCEQTSQHRTGAKDRVLYLTYLGLCKQLDPSIDSSESG